MLRVGLTGSLGSGKSTVAGLLRELGAEVCEADELGRALMEPGQQVFAEIVRVFGPSVVASTGRLDRGKLAALAFQGGRLQELNALIHPAVIAAQQRWMEEVFARSPLAVAVIESALIFEVERDARARGESEGVLADWRRRIDRIVVVTAPDELKIARYVQRLQEASGSAWRDRAAAEADARNRLAHQIPDAEKAARADFVLDNSADIPSLRRAVEAVWQQLQKLSNSFQSGVSLQ
jgi:dephospho-CoA kinase